MASVFTDHVCKFPAGCAAEDVLRDLEQLLRQRMRRRNLLSAPPAYLGYDLPSWSAEGAFEDLVADCYVFAILDRLKALQNQLRVRENIDGLIVRNVDNFLLQRQRRSDPIGYAVFGNVEAAARLGQLDHLLTVEDLRQGRLHNQSTIRFSLEGPGETVAGMDELRQSLENAPLWQEVLPHLVRTTEEGQEWVLSFLRQLQAAGVVALRCGDLVAVLATRARRDWTARHALPAEELAYEGDEGLGQLVRMLAPDTGPEDCDRWEWLKQEVVRQIAGLDRQQRVRERLGQVFGALVEAIEGTSEPPQQADLVRRLGVPRATLSDDFGLLRDILNRIRQGP
jgi:hypothetical protein